MPQVSNMEEPCYYSKPKFIRVKRKDDDEYRTLPSKRKEVTELCHEKGIFTKQVNGTRRVLCTKHVRETEN